MSLASSFSIPFSIHVVIPAAIDVLLHHLRLYHFSIQSQDLDLVCFRVCVCSAFSPTIRWTKVFDSSLSHRVFLVAPLVSSSTLNISSENSIASLTVDIVEFPVGSIGAWAAFHRRCGRFRCRFSCRLFRGFFCWIWSWSLGCYGLFRWLFRRLWSRCLGRCILCSNRFGGLAPIVSPTCNFFAIQSQRIKPLFAGCKTVLIGVVDLKGI